MYKVSVVGIDYSGKTSAVKALEGRGGIGTIHTFSDYDGSESRLARVSGGLVNRLAQLGERHDSKKLAGFAYLLHLAPYFLEQRAKKSHSLCVSDRDPVFDTLSHAEIYLPKGLSDKLYPPLKLFLSLFFSNPDLFVYLETSPEVAISRSNGKLQIHEDIDTLTRIKEIFDQEISVLEGNGNKVVKINTDPPKTLDEVIEEVKDTIGTESRVEIF